MGKTNLFQIHPGRRREVWCKKVPIFLCFKVTIKKVVYWDTTAMTGIAWSLENDRVGEWEYVRLSSLLEFGWERV